LHEQFCAVTIKHGEHYWDVWHTADSRQNHAHGYNIR
jgi:hypothetical protein